MLLKNSKSRKQQIARAAMEIIAEEGMHNLVMVKIAKRVGVTDAALYKHFKSKKDILFYMIEDIEKMRMEDAHLEELKLSGPELEEHKAMIAQELAKLKEATAKIAAVAGSVARE